MAAEEPGTESPAAIHAVGLGRRFVRHWALAHLDLAIPAGRAVLLAGPNGAGKTTLLRVIAGLLRPSQGELRVFGRDAVRERQACRRALSLVSHDAHLYDRLTALEMLRVWAGLLDRTPQELDLEALLEEVDLLPQRNVAVGAFSAGMRKRLALLRSRLERPRLLLLDEPFSSLDAEGRRLIARWTGEHRRAGGTLLLASHDLERAAELCDEAIVLRQGQLAWAGPAEGAARELGR